MNVIGSSIKFKNYKCFLEFNTIDISKKVNLLIGKNNCGKTSILDIIERTLSKKNSFNDLVNNSVIEFITSIPDDILASEFKSDMYSSNLYRYSGANISDFEVAKRALNNQKMAFPFLNSSSVDQFYTIISKTDKSFYSLVKWNSFTRRIKETIDKYEVYKISAERDIKQEKRDSEIVIDSNGNHITRFIEHHLHSVDGEYLLVKQNILKSLNDIMEGESKYDDIEVLNNSESLEIFLYENNKRIPLSLMGSGLKTILFVLVCLFFSKKKGKALFLFEELENNLHPVIFRRLIEFIYDFVSENDSLAFITSHSHVSINCLYDKPNANIFHIFKGENGSIVEPILNDIDKAHILNDLGVLASDIFQTNGIIWVEGPSDRVYIKKWLAIKYPELIENVHYSFLYYGGKVLSHFTADKKQEDSMINVLLTNRNGLIVMDHDESSEQEEIRETKKRVMREFESNNMYVWITKGKEIENYLRKDDINKAFPEYNDLEQVGEYEVFKDYISSIESNFANQKVAFSQKISFNDDSLKIMDLETRIDDIAERIKKWNNIC